MSQAAPIKSAQKQHSLDAQKTVSKNVPKLRFPGFKGEWKARKLGDLTTKVGSGSTPRGGSAVYKTSGVPFIRSQNVANGRLEMSDVVFIDRKIHESMLNSRLQPDDVLLNITGASLGRTCVVPSDFKEGNVNQHVCIIRLNETANPFLVHTILSQPRSLHELLKTQTGGGKEGLNFQAVRFFKVTLPDFDEQQKIAGFLTAVDDRVVVIDKRLKLLKKYKKGAMQKIFTQKIRFKDKNGKPYPNWQECLFGDAFEFHRTNSLSRAELSEKGDTMNIHYGDIHMRLGSHFDARKDRVSYLKSGDNSEMCKAGDLVIADASEDRTDIGKAVEIVDVGNQKIVAGLHTFLARPKNLALGFSGYLMRNVGVRKQLWRIATGASVLGISKTELAKTTINIPTQAEQQKIADFLTAIDDKIKLEEAKLTQAKKFKKSLLQRMFV